MTRIITDDEFVKAFDAAVEERGRDFVYPEEWKVPIAEFDPSNTTCLYNLDDGAPACVWGLAFQKLGLTPAIGVITDIQDMTSTANREDCEEYDEDAYAAVHWRERADVAFELSSTVRRAASRAQTAQDGGNTWGYASDLFHRALDGEAPGAD